MKKLVFVAALLASVSVGVIAFNSERTVASDTENIVPDPPQSKVITIRTKSYPRPPYSGATYYIYERDNQIICTKVETCNKYDNCSSEYNKGEWKDQMDVEYDEPYGVTKPVAIKPSKLKRHVCLTKFKLLN